MLALTFGYDKHVFLIVVFCVYWIDSRLGKEIKKNWGEIKLWGSAEIKCPWDPLIKIIKRSFHTTWMWQILKKFNIRSSKDQFFTLVKFQPLNPCPFLSIHEALSIWKSFEKASKKLFDKTMIKSSLLVSEKFYRSNNRLLFWSLGLQKIKSFSKLLTKKAL